MRKIPAALAAVVALSLGLTACGGNTTTAGSSASGKAAKTVKIAVVGDKQEPWISVQKAVKDKENITLQLVKFSDYVKPNESLNSGEVDLNSFQTQIFLDTYNKQHTTTLKTIGVTVMAPLGAYSKKTTKITDIAQNGTVSIPSDASNGGRALKLLETAGLLKVSASAGLAPTVKDITDNPKNLQIKALDAAQTARSLQDVDVAIINSALAVDAGLIPSRDAIFLEPVTAASAPYCNVIAARSADVDNETYKAVVKYYQTDATAQVIVDSTKGSQFPVWDGAPKNLKPNLSSASPSASA